MKNPFNCVQHAACKIWPYLKEVEEVELCLCIFLLFFRPLSTYETATTRQHYHGRTETCRSCTLEAIDLAKALEDQSGVIPKEVSKGPVISNLRNLQATGENSVVENKEKLCQLRCVKNSVNFVKNSVSSVDNIGSWCIIHLETFLPYNYDCDFVYDFEYDYGYDFVDDYVYERDYN